MTPEQLAKGGSEHNHQTAYFQWCAITRSQAYASNDPNAAEFGDALGNVFAIPNGDQRGDGTSLGAAIAGNRLKAEGQRSGVPDIFLAWPVWYLDQGIACDIKGYGLFIEMKKPGMQTKKDGGCSKEQLDWHEKLRQAGYKVVVCYSWEEARDQTCNYLKGN